jgi:uncharacterized protein
MSPTCRPSPATGRMMSGGPELVPVRVQPRAGRDEILGWRDGVLRVRVSAPPVEGEANRAVGALLARVLGVGASAVIVARGARGRDKLVRVRGMTRRMVMERLAALLLAVGIVVAGASALDGRAQERSRPPHGFALDFGLAADAAMRL